VTETSQGTDVTETFETHHITSKASEVLKKFYAREAQEPRNYKLTFNDDGFYKTLKRRVAQKLASENLSSGFDNSKLIHDLNLIALVVSTYFATQANSFVTLAVLTVICSQFMAWSANFAHNFIHQKDNWRMYTANISLMGWRDYRVFHVMSHHMFPNTITDLETSNFEKYLIWLPTQAKTKESILWSYFNTPFSYFNVFKVAFMQRFVNFFSVNDDLLIN
jgi:tRNA U38,U39,U40 pseudouridine synthase TruA